MTCPTPRTAQPRPRGLRAIGALMAMAALVVAVFAVPTQASAASGHIKVIAWGQWNASNESQNFLEDVTVPDVLNTKNVKDISAAQSFALALTEDGEVVAWGGNSKGQTNVPDSIKHIDVDGTEHTSGKAVKAISAGYQFALALTEDDEVVAWGNNDYGQADVPDSLGDKKVTAISAGFSHALAVTEDGAVVAWGNNGSNKATVPTFLKRIDAAGTAVTDVAAGYDFSVVLTRDGAVYAWGNGTYNQTNVNTSLTRLDRNGTKTEAQLVKIPNGETGKTIAAGQRFALAVGDDDKIYTWGNYAPDLENKLDGKIVTKIAAGQYYKSTGTGSTSYSALALTNEGKVVGLGTNAHGETTVPNFGDKEVQAIAAGGTYSLALAEVDTLPTTISVDPSQVKVGDTTTVTVGVTNPSDTSQTLLNSLSVTVPDGFTYVTDSSSSSEPTVEGTTLTFTNVGTLDANGGQLTLTFKLQAASVTSGTVAVTSGDTGSVVAEVEPSDTAQLIAVEPLTTSVSANTTEVKIGDTATVTVGVTNPNVVDQTLEELKITIPDGFDYVANSSTDVEPTVDGNVLTFSNPGTLAAVGEDEDELTFTFELKAASVGIGFVSVSSSQTTSDVEVTASDSPESLEALAVLPSTVSVDPEQVKVGDKTTVTVGATNPNVTDQTLNSLTVTIPTGFTYVTDSSSSSEPTVEGTTLTFTDLGTLDANGGELTFTFELQATGVTSGDVVVTSGQTASVAEVEPSAAAQLIAVEPLTTSVSANTTEVKIGDTATVTVGVTNPNVIAQTLEELKITIPDGFEYVANSSTDVEPTVDGNVLTFSNPGTLAAVGEDGDELTFTFELKAASVGIGFVSVSSSQTTSDVEVTPSDSPESLVALTALRITISFDPAQLTVGDTTTVEVGVTNPNVVEQTLEELKITIPNGFTYVANSSSISEPAVDGNELTFTNLGTLDANGGELTFTFKLLATDVTSGDVEVTSGETDSVADVELSATAQLSAVEPEVPSTESESQTSSDDETSDELPQTGDSANPAAAVALAAAATLATGAALALTRRGRGAIGALLAMAALVVAAFGVPAQAFATSDDTPNAVFAWGNYGIPDALGLDNVNIVGISAGHGGTHSMALTSDGAAVAWGSNISDATTVPTFLKRIDAEGVRHDGKVVKAVSAGQSVSLVLTEDDAVYAWGWNNGGATDVPTTIRHLDADGNVLEGKGVDEISTSNFNSLVLTEDGALVAWGLDGTDSYNRPVGNTTVPTTLKRLDADGTMLDGKTVTDISTGLSFSLALTEEGAVVAWGNPNDGKTTVPTSLRRLDADGNVLDGKKVIAIAAGSTHSLALTEDGAVVAWGGATQLDIPENLKRIDTDGVEHDGEKVAAISAGTYYSLALTEDGKAFNWGSDLQQQGPVPTSFENRTVTAISVGSQASLALVALEPLPTTITPDPDQIPVGDTTSLTVSVTNPNINTQTLSELTLAIPEGFEYVADDAAGDHVLSEDGRTLTFTDLGTLTADGGELSFNLELRAVATVPTQGTVEVTSGQTASGVQVETSDAHADLIILVPLDTTIATDPAQILVGDTSTVTVGVTNTNLTDQQVGSLTVSIPEGFEYVDDSSSISEPEKSEDGQTLTFTNLGTLDANGGELTFTFELKAEASGEGFVGVDPGETPIGLPILPSSVELTAVEPEVPSAESAGSLPQTGDSAGPAAVVALAATTALVVGAMLAIEHRTKARR